MSFLCMCELVILKARLEIVKENANKLALMILGMVLIGKLIYLKNKAD